ncbi:hypothetical protein AN477_22860 [Alicyclobacillus ferrooxydans]|uniref:Uncharacterized protein n=1 Tax=Alicyclobacillus ferrooxydans TaxID=471514 RepID=A0A0P9CRQ3_9BACL|nr:hypothetical protein AN477_22860 [Alicyclobacillus ferrooxydans]
MNLLLSHIQHWKFPSQRRFLDKMTPSVFGIPEFPYLPVPNLFFVLNIVTLNNLTKNNSEQKD